MNTQNVNLAQPRGSACPEAHCTECGDQVDEVIGCPDGAELCQSCFDLGAH